MVIYGGMYIGVFLFLNMCLCAKQTKTKLLQCRPLQISHVNLKPKNFQVREQHSQIMEKKNK